MLTQLKMESSIERSVLAGIVNVALNPILLKSKAVVAILFITYHHRMILLPAQDITQVQWVNGLQSLLQT